jgi:hypothetical protein
MPTDHERLREVAYWRTLLVRVAEDLEHTAGVESDPKRKRWYESRATRIRQRPYEGLPKTFAPRDYHSSMTPADHLTTP